MEGTPYLDDVPPRRLRWQKLVFVDFDRRSNMLCMHEDSSSEPGERRTLEIAKEAWAHQERSREFRRLRSMLKTDEVRAAERRLRALPDGGRPYTTEGAEAYNRLYAEVGSVLDEHYTRPAYFGLELLEDWNRRSNLAMVIRRVRTFAAGATLVVGDCLMRNARYFESMPHVSLLVELVEAGLRILLVDGHAISKYCPECRRRKVVPCSGVSGQGPRDRQEQAEAPGKELLCCPDCRSSDGEQRYWSKDVLTCLNMRHIAQGHRDNGR